MKLCKRKIGWALEYEGKTVAWYETEEQARKGLEFWLSLVA